MSKHVCVCVCGGGGGGGVQTYVYTVSGLKYVMHGCTSILLASKSFVHEAATRSYPNTVSPSRRMLPRCVVQVYWLSFIPKSRSRATITSAKRSFRSAPEPRFLLEGRNEVVLRMGSTDKTMYLITSRLFISDGNSWRQYFSVLISRRSPVRTYRVQHRRENKRGLVAIDKKRVYYCSMLVSKQLRAYVQKNNTLPLIDRPWL